MVQGYIYVILHVFKGRQLRQFNYNLDLQDDIPLEKELFLISKNNIFFKSKVKTVFQWTCYFTSFLPLVCLH